MSDCPKHYWCLPERCPECPDACDQACVCHGQFTAPTSCKCCTSDTQDTNANSDRSEGHNDE
jgi:hypothetical protein